MVNIGFVVFLSLHNTSCAKDFSFKLKIAVLDLFLDSIIFVKLV